MSRISRWSLAAATIVATGAVALPARVHLARAQEPRRAPSWENSSWLNTQELITLESLRGRVVLLNFWVFTSASCTNTIPSLVDFDRKYRERGLTLIGIHTPESPPSGGEHDPRNVGAAILNNDIPYPVALDNDHGTWKLYGIKYRPSFVLIDKAGKIRYEGHGEFHLNDAAYNEWSRRIEALLGE